MTLAQYLIMISLSGVFSWVGFLLVLFRMNPNTGGTAALLLFYATLFLAVASTFTLIGFGIRRLLERDVLPIRQIGVAGRQAFFFAIFLTSTFLLLGTGYFTWWNAPVILIFLGTIEYFFLASSQNPR
jgi:hypothetical protein